MKKNLWSVQGNSVTTIAVLAAAGGTFAVLQSIVGPALPMMQRELNTDQLGATWIMTSYLLSASILTPVVGRLGDSLGKKRVLITVLLLLAAGTAVSALAENITTMIIGRLIQGVGGGAFPLAFGILRDHFDGQKLNQAVGTVAGIGAGCAGLGGVLSGLVVESAGFRWLFWGPMIIILAATLIVAALPASPRSSAPLSAGSVILFTVWLASLLLFTSQARIWGTTSAPILTLFALSVCGVLAWILVERRSKGPLLDLKMMRQNTMWTTSVSAALLGVVLYGLQTFLPQFVQTSPVTGYGLGLSILQSGLVLLPMSAAIFVMGLISAKLARRFGERTIMVAGPAIAALGLLFLLFTPVQLWQALVASGLSGVGVGLTLASMPALVIASVPKHQSGVAGGINANLRTVGGALGAALIASVISAVPGEFPTAVAYQTGFFITTMAAILAVVIGICMTRSARQTATDDKSEASIH